MENIVIFISKLKKEILEDDLLSIANGLTYKLLLSIFPFLIFLISIVAFLELDPTYLLDNISDSLPDELFRIVSNIINEITLQKHPSLLSSSLAIAIWSASTGFRSLIKGINKAYGQKETRSIIKLYLLSIAFVIIFTFTIIISMVMLIFRDKLLNFLRLYFDITPFMENLYGLIGYFIALCIILFTIMWMNKVSVARNITFSSVIPGSVLTVLTWIVSSKAFNIYVNTFSNYPTVYGSIAGVIILMLWLNIICIVFLFGSEVNAILEDSLK